MSFSGGVERKRIFRKDTDRERLLELAADGVTRFGHELHAFCLMDNHIHMLVRVGPTPLAKVMQNLSTRYVQGFNRKYKRVGPLFQGRYKAILVAEDAYLLPLVAYIHQNPVRARLVADPAEYAWSSHRLYLADRSEDWLCTEDILEYFGGDKQAFDRFVRGEYIDRDTRRELTGKRPREQRVAGNDQAVANVMARAGRRALRTFTVPQILGAVCELYGIEMHDLRTRKRTAPFSEARALAAYAVRQLRGPTLSDYGRQIGRSVTTLSNLARQWENALAKNERASRLTSRLEEKLDVPIS